jgi:hypothetical protein
MFALLGTLDGLFSSVLDALCRKNGLMSTPNSTMAV